jgi:hypothetical protein
MTAMGEDPLSPSAGRHRLILGGLIIVGVAAALACFAFIWLSVR